ncbi:putative carboxypeptidase S1 [Paraphoma chrysanthemicola]|uniref:Carboxypeptidase n=1 Tax=Paraphoma chrysanthemicola TaxID=798071 RepID=A0A8K0VWY4_9PLEO|nr:putative carboxypeptidase S1 [Paraphoma chrysanthemicola]
MWCLPLLVFPYLASCGFAHRTAAHDKRSFVERAGVVYNVFEHGSTGARIEFIMDSSICEMTPGVKQYSGYLSVGNNLDMWFWFFEARNSPTTAPLAAWFNGGPGCSSMIGLFQENGPCKFELGAQNTKPINNTFSWNNNVNMLYIDQPVEVGFSMGNSSAISTDTASPYVWTFLQAFYAAFPTYKSRDFGIFTESYGGHFGAAFTKYIQEQNRAKAGEHINIVALGINNGWHDSIIQTPAYVDFAYNNTYRPFITPAQHTKYKQWYEDYCLPDLLLCNTTGSNFDCATADRACTAVVESPLYNLIDFDLYDIRKPSNNNEPPNNFLAYLKNKDVLRAIGAKRVFEECSAEVSRRFVETGDSECLDGCDLVMMLILLDSRSYLDELSEVVRSGITTLIWAGDADYICNWYGVFDVANQIEYPGRSAFSTKPLEPYTVGGVARGSFKTQDNLSFLRVYEAGHMVMYYRQLVSVPELSLQVFEQTMRKRVIVPM